MLILLVVAVFATVLAVLFRSAWADNHLFTDGDGSLGDPYQIASCQQLQNMQEELASSFVLINDIDCSAFEGFESVGDLATPFTGSFNGDGHTVSSLSINGSYGLFGDVDGADITDARLVDIEVTTTNQKVGGLAGQVYGESSITDSYVTGSISSSGDYIAGLVGTTGADVTVEESYSAASVSGGDFSAGFVAINDGLIVNSFATGDVEGAGDQGGLVAFGSGTINKSYFAGRLLAAIIVQDDWSSTGTVNNTSPDIGPASETWSLLEGQLDRDNGKLVVDETAEGISLATIETNATDGILTMSALHGGSGDSGGHTGFAARVASSSSLITAFVSTDCGACVATWDGNTFDLLDSAGSVSHGTIYDMTLTLSGDDITFHVVGDGIDETIAVNTSFNSSETRHGIRAWGGGSPLDSPIEFYPFTMAEDLNFFVRGLIWSNDGGTVTNSFWDMQRSGAITSNAGTGKTILQMKNVATFTNTATTGLSSPWDFVDNPNNDVANDDIWDIHADANNGYPYLTALFADPDASAPNAPTNLATATISSSQIDLSWDAPVDDGGSAITGYKIERKIEAGSFSTLVADTGSTDTTYEDTGLDSDTLHTYRVSAINAIGTSSASGEASETTDKASPTVSTEAATSVGQTDATLQGDLTSLGDFLTVDVFFRWREKDSGDPFTDTAAQEKTSTGTFDQALSDLAPDTIYEYKAIVQWEDSGTQEDEGSLVEFTTDPLVAPDAPTNLSATAASISQINLSWDAPVSNGGSAITGYKIERKTGGGSFSTIVADTESTDTTYEDTGLSEGTTYTYRLSAINAIGTSDPSGEASATTESEDEPDPEVNTAPSATSLTNISQVTNGDGYVTFMTTISDEDADSTRLKVEYSTDEANWHKANIVSVSPSAGSVTVSNGATYQIGSIDTDAESVQLTIKWNSQEHFADQARTVYLRVTPNDNSDDGTSKTSAAFFLDNRPPQIENFRLASRTATSLTVEWDIDEDESNFDQYTICYGTNASHVASCDRTASTRTITNGNTSGVTLAGLQKNKNHFITLTAVDTRGNSLTLELNQVATIDLPPFNVTITDIIGSTIKLIWDKVTSPTFLRYELCYSINQQYVQGSNCHNQTSKITYANSNTTSTTVLGLLEQTLYYFTVRVFDSVEEKIVSNVASTVTCLEGETNINGVCVAPASVVIQTPVSSPTATPTPVPTPTPVLTPTPSSSPIFSPNPGAGGDGLEGLVEGVGSIVEQVQEAVEEVAQAVVEVVQTVTEAVSDAVQEIFVNSVEVVQEVIESFKEVIQQLPETTRNIVEAAKRIPEDPVEAIREIRQEIKPVAESPAAQVTTATVTTSAAVATIATQPALAATASNFASQLFSLFERLWQGLLGLAGLKSRRRPWGRVVNAHTGEPLASAQVQIVNHQTERVVDATVTDDNGAFSSYLSPGSYNLRVAKRGWIMTPEAPFLSIIGGEKIYDGRAIAVVREKLAPLVVAMRQAGGVEGRIPLRKRILRGASYVLARLSWPLLIIGLLINSVVLLGAPSSVSVGTEIFYILLIIMKVLVARRFFKASGLVTDAVTHKPLGRAIVRILDAASGTLVGTRVTSGKSGSFFLLVPPGVYTVTVAHEGYEPYTESHVIMRSEGKSPVALSFAMQPLSKGQTKSVVSKGSVQNAPRPLTMLILDGYGLSPVSESNAVAAAHQPNMQKYFEHHPWVSLTAAGIEVGLPRGEMGNSETGHQNIGSGRVLYQPLPRISLAIEDESFFSNPVLLAAIEHVRQRPGAALHTMGMASDGGVHSHVDHQIALLELAARSGIGDRTYVHAFLDGRDSAPDSAGNFINQIAKRIKKLGVGHLVSMVGRYYAMDRNQNWDRTQVAYDLLVGGQGDRFTSWQEALKNIFRKEDKRGSYETAPPVVLSAAKAAPRMIRDGDAVILYNFREDRSVQLALAFTDPAFAHFPVAAWQDLFFVTMTDYGHGVRSEIVFPAETITTPLGKVISDYGLKQLRVAESEKFAHVTYFMNGGREEPFPGEDQVAIPSANVKDYSKKPHMSAEKISDTIIQAVQNESHDVIIANYANPDMIAHTGKFAATVQALEYLDGQIGRVVDAVLAAHGAVLITGDHGNAEDMVNRLTDEATTDHTTNPVPLIYITPDNRREQGRDKNELEQIAVEPVGILADVAPTVLEIMGLDTPPEMTSQSVLSNFTKEE